MSANLFIRDATRADLAFLVDSNATMALETEHKTVERGICAVVDCPARGSYLIAECNARAVGCLLVTYE
jgi:hypothetical protein